MIDLFRLAEIAQQYDKFVVNMKKHPCDVYVGRPSPWGNPYSNLPGTKPNFRVDNREEAVTRFEEYLLANPTLLEQVKKELKGKILGCHCSPKLCHGHILAKIANEP